MKKWIYFVTAICLVAALTGCNRQGNVHGADTESTGCETTQTTDTVATEETLAHATGEAELDFSDFE